MARAFLRWSIGELAETAAVGLSTVQAIETADGAPNVGLGMAQTKAHRETVRADSVEAIRKTLVAAGITSLPDDGRNGAGKGTTINATKRRHGTRCMVALK